MSDPADLHSLLSEIRTSVGKTQTDMEWVKSSLQRGERSLDDQETRIRNLESAHSNAAGRYSVISSIAGVFAGSLGAFLMRHLPT